MPLGPSLRTDGWTGRTPYAIGIPPSVHLSRDRHPLRIDNCLKTKAAIHRQVRPKGHRKKQRIARKIQQILECQLLPPRRDERCCDPSRTHFRVNRRPSCERRFEIPGKFEGRKTQSRTFFRGNETNEPDVLKGRQPCSPTIRLDIFMMM